MKKLLAAVLLISLFGCEHFAEMQKEKEKGSGKNYEYEANTIRCNTASLYFEVSYLSPEQADVYFSYFRDGKYKNPFPPTFIVFLVSIQNRGKNTTNFNPGLAWLYPNKGYPASAKDYTSLYSDFDLANADDIDERMAAFRASSFDGSEVIPPGATVKKLIVFTRGKDKFDKAGLVFENIYSGKVCDNVKFMFPRGLGLE